MAYPAIKYFKNITEVNKEVIIRDKLSSRQLEIYQNVCMSMQNEFPKEPIVLEIYKMPDSKLLKYRITTAVDHPSNSLFDKFVKAVYSQYHLTFGTPFLSVSNY